MRIAAHRLLIIFAFELTFAMNVSANTIGESYKKFQTIKQQKMEECRADLKGEICIEMAERYDLGSNENSENSNFLSVDLLKVSCEKGNSRGCNKLKTFKANHQKALDCYDDYETGNKCYSQGLVHLKQYRREPKDETELRYARFYFHSACQRKHSRGCEENRLLNTALNSIESVYPERGSAITLSMSNDKVTGILIRGVIRKGDFEEFEGTVKRYDGKLGAVFLDSPGGDAIEAMKIGRLIRELQLETWAPGGSAQTPTCWGQNKEDRGKLCTCLSACVLIHLAGTKRYGEVLGVHRIYPSHEILKDLSAEEAKKLHEAIKAEAANYFSLLAAPKELLEMLLSVPSNRIKYLDASEVSKLVPNLVPEYQEWILAKCGDPERLYIQESRWLKKNSDKVKKETTFAELQIRYPDYAKIRTEIDKSLDCARTLLNKMQKDAYSKKYPGRA